jgi:S-DNA-T family DNA segregation ATPase FtsK/SpoIIIE
MGFFLRKNIKFGPFRINLSKSGIGVSGGIKGARISAGPRGTQLNLGRKSAYYRKQVSSRTSRGGGWVARLFAFFFPSRQLETVQLIQSPTTNMVGEPTSQCENLHSALSAPQGLVPTLSISSTKNGTLDTKPTVSYENYSLPSIDLLNEAPDNTALNDDDLLDTATRLAECLREFGVTGQMKQISPGPIFTTYAFQPDPGIKYSRITSLADDLCLASKSVSIDIERIPGTALVALRLPNQQRQTIYLRQILQSTSFRESPSKLTVAIGETIDGMSYVANLAAMPHLLIAGAPGQGKSIFLHSLIVSLLYRARPDEVRLILIDSAGAEMTLYSDVPHLIAPVITEPSIASSVLGWTVNEMERRYRELSAWGVRDIEGYNAERSRRSLIKDFGESVEPWPLLPYIVICIDDLADLLSIREVETFITRVAQKGHTVGVHLVLATQRPSVDVISGLIKASISSRVAFRVSSKVDALAVMNEIGAEKLLGRGDMLFVTPGLSHPLRVHGAYVDSAEIRRIVAAVKSQGAPMYDAVDKVVEAPHEVDDLFEEALRICVDMKRASTSVLQRRLRIGYGRAAELLDTMECHGLIGQADGARPRPVLRRAFEVVGEWDTSRSKS